MDTRIISMLMRFFPDTRPTSRAQLLHAGYDALEIDTALDGGYIMQCGHNAVGASPLYVITEKGSDLRNR